MYHLINDIFQAQEILSSLEPAQKLKICLPVDRIGVNLGNALKELLEERYDAQIEIIAADAAEFPGVALHALHLGFKEVLFAGDSISLESLQQEAEVFAAKIISYDNNARNSLIVEYFN